MLDTLQSLLAWLAIVAASLAVGRPLARRLSVGRGDAFAEAVWSLALGLLACGGLLTGLGLVGALSRPLIVVLTAAAACWGLGEALGLLAARRTRRALARDEIALSLVTPSPVHAGPSLSRSMVAGLGGLVVVALAASFLAALAPPTAGDALCYHLDLPKTFLAEQGLVDVAYNDNAAYPLLVELWYAWALALDGGVAAQLMHWTLGGLFGGAAVLLARPLLGQHWAYLAGAIVLLVPGITNQMTAPLNDVALAAFTTLALVAWRAACGTITWPDATTTDARAAIHAQFAHFALAGLMLGAALSTKYVAFVFAAAVAAVWCVQLVRRPGQRHALISGAAITASVAIAVAGVWYIRAAWLRGDPVYPFLSDVGSTADKTPLGLNPLAMLAAPWLVTFRPEQFGGRGHELGPLWLAALPCLLVVRRLRGLASLLAIAGVYAVMWLVLRQNVRFFYPALPCLAVAVVWLVVELEGMSGVPRRLALASLAVMLAVGALWPVYRLRDKLLVAIGVESRDEFLAREEPTFRAAQAANRILPDGARLLSQDYRGFYFDLPVTREAIFRRETAYDAALASASEPSRVSAELRGRGFTHVLVAESAGPAGIRYEPTLSRLIDAELHRDGDRSLARLANYEFVDSDGARRRYRLFLLR